MEGQGKSSLKGEGGVSRHTPHEMSDNAEEDLDAAGLAAAEKEVRTARDFPARYTKAASWPRYLTPEDPQYDELMVRHPPHCCLHQRAAAP